MQYVEKKGYVCTALVNSLVDSQTND